MSISNPASVFPETLISLLVDKSSPLTLILQLFWFDELISEFMQKRKTFATKSGVIIMLSHHFKYEPVEMESGRKVAYLYGFHSNLDGEAYAPLEIKCVSEEEKLGITLQIGNALQELVNAAAKIAYAPHRSLRIQVGLDRDTGSYISG